MENTMRKALWLVVALVGVCLLGLGLQDYLELHNYQAAEAESDEWAADGQAEVFEAIESGELEISPPTEGRATADSALVRATESYTAAPTVTGEPDECLELPVVGRIQIDRIGIEVPVFGDDARSLRCGPMHHDTPWLDADGTTFIAGHRTTWGAPFRNIDQLEPGDLVRVTAVVDGALEEVEYRIAVAGSKMGDGLVLAGQRPPEDQLGEDTLLLYACHPVGSNRQRIYVTAEPVI